MIEWFDPSDGTVYFHKQDNIYADRHNVLFNLYAFDTYRSNRTHSPTLNLIDCDFEYFFDMQALIQVETNNYIQMGNQYDTGAFDANTEEGDEFQGYRFLGLAGEDRGARINITSSTFKHSKFCKGLLTYRRQPTIYFEDSKKFVNITAGQDR